MFFLRKILSFIIKWFWRLCKDSLKALRSPARRHQPNLVQQSIYKIFRVEYNREYSLEGLMLNLKLQYSGPWCEQSTYWKRPWCWEGLGAGGEGDDRGWDGWMASPTWWTWVWVDSGRPGVLQFMGSQRVGHDWATELNWTEESFYRKRLNKPFGQSSTCKSVSRDSIFRCSF